MTIQGSTLTVNGCSGIFPWESAAHTACIYQYIDPQPYISCVAVRGILICGRCEADVHRTDGEGDYFALARP